MPLPILLAEQFSAMPRANAIMRPAPDFFPETKVLSEIAQFPAGLSDSPLACFPRPRRRLKTPGKPQKPPHVGGKLGRPVPSCRDLNRSGPRRKPGPR